MVLAKVTGVWLLPRTGLDTPDARLNDKEARINPHELNDVDLGLAISGLTHASRRETACTLATHSSFPRSYSMVHLTGQGSRNPWLKGGEE